jgi:hypothetical protein
MFIHTYKTQNTDLRWADYGWHVVEFKTPIENRSEITRWCHQTFGPAGRPRGTTETRWKDSIRFGEIYFKHPEDLEWFVLRWA